MSAVRTPCKQPVSSTPFRPRRSRPWGRIGPFAGALVASSSADVARSAPAWRPAQAQQEILWPPTAGTGKGLPVLQPCAPPCRPAPHTPRLRCCMKWQHQTERQQNQRKHSRRMNTVSQTQRPRRCPGTAPQTGSGGRRGPAQPCRAQHPRAAPAGAQT